jgi:hypothetical protein
MKSKGEGLGLQEELKAASLNQRPLFYLRKDLPPPFLPASLYWPGGRKIKSLKVREMILYRPGGNSLNSSLSRLARKDGSRPPRRA